MVRPRRNSVRASAPARGNIGAIADFERWLWAGRRWGTTQDALSTALAYIKSISPRSMPALETDQHGFKGGTQSMVSGVSDGGGLLQAAARAQQTGQEYGAAMMKKVNDQQKIEGENAVRLIESASAPASGSVGRNVDTVA